MHITSAKFLDFKRFKSLEIRNIPASAKLVILVGPSGSGKSSVFDGFLHWQRIGKYHIDDAHFEYLLRSKSDWGKRQEAAQGLVTISFGDEKEYAFGARADVFYLRSAYRFEGAFTLTTFGKLKPILEDDRISTMSDSDVSVSKNYVRLVSQIIADLHKKEDDINSKGEWRDSKYRPLQEAVSRLFPGLELQGPGNPMEEGTFLFSKGSIKDFRYGNLSSGEKAVLDLLLDLHVRGAAYNNSIFCIDEPEAHVNTNLHGPVIDELYKFIPVSGQMWIATHSVGMIRRAMELSRISPGAVAFLDFHDLDLDKVTQLYPAVVNPSFWTRNLRTMLADLSELVAPKQIVLCEGARRESGVRNAEFDAQCYQRIFESEFPDTVFISVGASNDILTGSAAIRGLLGRLANGVKIITIIDRDERTDEEIVAAQRVGHRVLPKRHLEHYLLSDEAIKILCMNMDPSDGADDILAGKVAALNNLPSRNRAIDDVKSVKGDIYNAVKQKFLHTGVKFGSNADAFCRDVMAPLIRPGTTTYAELKSAIFET